MLDAVYIRYSRILEGRNLPAALVDMDLVDANIRQVLAKAGPKSVRIATKSLRCEPLIRYILASDSRFQGLMCYTLPEALWLAERGFADILVAYPAAGRSELALAARSAAAGRPITLMADSYEHLDRIEAAAEAENTVVPVCLDLDLSSDFGALHFGVHRSGLKSSGPLVALARRAADSPRLAFDGIMGYEAQIAGLGDSVPGAGLKNAVVRLLKRLSIRELRNRRASVLDALRNAGLEPRFVNGGGTGSLTRSAEEPGLSEVTAGSAFFAPALFDNYRDFRFEPAAFYAVPIVRRPAGTIYTCLGGGYIASGVAAGDKSPKPYLPAGAALDPNEGAGEVQTPVHYSGPIELGLGDPVFFRHAKAGELCERFLMLNLVRGEKIVDEVPTYRGEGKCFL